MRINRSVYFNKILPFVDKPVVKVITGIRRCGKSVMMEQIQDYLVEKGINTECILSLNFESFTDERVQSFESVTSAVKTLVKNSGNKKLYLFFDEIQELDGWEKLINSYMIDFNCDIYITGSNAKLLSGELATYLAGRYIEIKMYPFSFAESFEALKLMNPKISQKEAFDVYVNTGGYPFLYNFDFSESQKKQYLDDIFNSIILKDICDRYKIRDVALLKSLITFFISNIANIFSSSSLIKYLKNEKRSLSTETVYNYLEYCKEACLLHLVSRQNIEGKDILSTQEKIFITDHGIRQSLFMKNQKDINQILENIVYIELLRRGYSVTVGKTKNQEIDFCAQNENGIEYFQVCYLLTTEETVQREFGAYDFVKDNYPKYVLSLDDFDFSQNGIIHKNVIKWLLEE
ncbi:ATP-binding protein [Treponema sp.]|uniref:ATP-binding protein n=1 Tax=Treponema sp. TaxID=166 RepID=UPI00388F7C79